MARKIIQFQKKTSILAAATAVGEFESRGPLKEYFDISSPDSKFGMDTWEKSEAEMVRIACETAMKKSRLKPEDIDLSLSGDLTNQCAASTFGLKDYKIPHIGI